MAASGNNSWVDSYLEALLSYGLSGEYTNKPAQARADVVDADQQIYAKYYVSQILQLGEEGIRDAWYKATSSSHTGERDRRLEYLSWRVWHMKRAKQRVWEEGRRIAATLPDDSDAVVLEDHDFSTSDDDEHHRSLRSRSQSDLHGRAQTSGGASPTAAEPPSASDNFLQTDYEDDKSWGNQRPRDLMDRDVLDKGLYIILISMHGLVRGESMELGKDPDTGGQVKYVVELARALAQHPVVYRVDLLTRLIKDPQVDKEYGQSEECLYRSEQSGSLGGAYIVRLPAGKPEVYIRKEQLWPHLREFADRGIAHAKSTLMRLAEDKTPCDLYAVHGHYADAGEVAFLMTSTLGVDMALTGHSLGRNKLEHLLNSGTVSKAEIESTYKISRRIEAEERSLEGATMVFTSTQQEIDEQWGLYNSFDAKIERTLRQRRRDGRHMPHMVVIPPGLDFSSLKVDLPKDPALEEMKAAKPAFGSDGGSPRQPARGGSAANLRQLDSDAGSLSSTHHRTGSGLTRPVSMASLPGGNLDDGTSRLRHQVSKTAPTGKTDPPIWKEIFRFLRNPRKPVILAMSRPDAKKNITTLVKAFGENHTLRSLANLVLIMGNRDNIDSMASGSSKVLQQVLRLVDSHDLYGSVAYPKKHSQADISDIYRLPQATRGVFTNVALQEPFGLTVIEAAAHGVPTVATKNGGPVDIMATLHHGLLVDPGNSTAIAEACLKILTNSQLWDDMSHNGVNNIMAYSWPSHCKKYLEVLESEKQFLRKQQKDAERRYSGSWDHRSALPATISEEQGAPGRAMMDRMRSTPHRGLGPNLHKVSAPPKGSFKGPGKRPTKLTSDDGSLNKFARTSSHDFDHLRGFHRDYLVVVQVDGLDRIPAFGPILKQAIQAAASSNGTIGVGVASMLGFEATAHCLEEAGVSLDALDFSVNNSGADIWHNTSKEQGGPHWQADESWEEHINFRWERDTAAKLVTKLLAGDKSLQSVPSLPGKMSTALSKALGSLPEHQQGGVHPQHVLLELDDESKSHIMGMAPSTQQKETLSSTMMERIRRRLRKTAYRSHIVLQMVPEGDELHSHMHITPLRASRALALRFIATKFGLDMQRVMVVTVPAKVVRQDEVAKVTGHTTDMLELLGGWCKVVITIPEKDETRAPRKTKMDASVMERLAIKVVPGIFNDHIHFLEGTSDLANLVSQASAGGAKDS
ncbi:hypothetical protein WJX73_004061 [Symbiochloris irregularis]|uniref:sucrose-phosphate synthase n=1 Tax=Symbiochloris irregularis TaxID=706552 RepID=A0AAW1PHI4_9CHLO